MAKQPKFFTVTEDNQATIITFNDIGGLAEDEARDEARIEWDQFLEQLTPADCRKLFIVDLSQLNFLGPFILVLMVILWQRLDDQPRFAVAGASIYGQATLKLAKFDTIWPLFPTREEAIQTLSKQ